MSVVSLVDSERDPDRHPVDYEMLLEIGVKLSGSLDLATVLEIALETAEEVCRAETSSIWEVDEEKQDLYFRVVRGRAAGEIRDLRVPVGQGIVGSVAASGIAEVVNDVAKDARWHGDPKGFQTRAILTVPLLVQGKVIGVLQLLNPVEGERFTESDKRRMTLFAGVLAPPLLNARLHAQQERQNLNMVTALAETIAQRDPYTGGHVHRVVRYSILLGAELGLGRALLKDLYLAATVHDIGKIRVPDIILSKPAPLTREEVEIMNLHPVIGAEIVRHLGNPAVLVGVRNHHERMDGKGYPDGLIGDELPLVARIIAVADTYDAMITSRPYRSGFPPEQAAAEIIGAAGSQLCPRVVAAFRALFERGSFTLAASESVLLSVYEPLSPDPGGPAPPRLL
ncbi:MAG TPA: HD domain-containing phosphohydrolase [Thermoanaerobaculia bacterium]|jgi:HD-GYP domain-containing protein (c-di-GMP phosphodiesterase class II)